MPSPQVENTGPSPSTPTYRPESPDYSPGTPQFEQPATPGDELDEDEYDYDDEYGFYDPGPANLEEIIKEYDESRKKMGEEQSPDELPSAFDENFRAVEEEEDDEKKDEPERTVIEKDFNEGLNLLATEDDEGKDENDSGDEDDSDRKSVTA